MFFLVWIILFFILFWVVIVVSYWEKLLRSKDVYTREELIYFLQIFDIQLRKMNPEHSILGYIMFSFGVLIAWLLTLFGGLISPDTGPEPDYASNEMANYFFQSALFVFMLHIVWPSLKFFLEERFAPQILIDLMNQDKPFFTGLSITLPSISLACWGMYHQIHFLFVLINGVILLTYAAYQIQREKDHEQNAQPDDKEEIEV
jgi:hypothetical protein